MNIIPAIHRWRSNAELIADVHQLRYLTDDMEILDATYANGTFWKEYRPARLHVPHAGFDFTQTLYSCGRWDAVVFDPPYKLNGRPDPKVDACYGVDVPATWEERMELIFAGFTECARIVKPGGRLLVKCMDQVARYHLRWQTYELYKLGEKCGMWLEDEFTFAGHTRKQPMEGRKQRHAHGRGSTLMIFRKEVPT